MRKSRKLVIAVKCDYCKTETESFVVNANGLRFCRIQTPGYPPDKDCQAEHTRNKNVQKKEKEKILIYKQKILTIKFFYEFVCHIKFVCYSAAQLYLFYNKTSLLTLSRHATF